MNFTGSSVPDEIVKFLFSDLLMLLPMLLDQTPSQGIYSLPEEQQRMDGRTGAAGHTLA